MKKEINWIESTEEKYNYALEVLPPAFWDRRAQFFLVGEPADHENGKPVFEAWKTCGGHFYYCDKNLTIQQAGVLVLTSSASKIKDTLEV